MLRSFVTWLVIFAVLLFAVSAFGWIGAVELLLLLVLSIALTLVYRRGQRARARSS